jgi:hypothetical protein
MKSGDVLYNALMKEADRVAKLGYPAPAHDLRSAAGDVSSANSLLESSKRNYTRAYVERSR